MKTQKYSHLLLIAKLRVIIGFLGEKNQFSWWSSSFYSSFSRAFLVPVFGKTLFLSQYYGVREAAGRIHDEHIGVGKGVFHLYRLPEIIERQLHNLLCKQEIVDQLDKNLCSEESAKNALESLSLKDSPSVIGPVRVGGLDDMNKKSIWQLVARYYNLSFRDNLKAFPYFSEEI